jgi:carboxymethylenebutenolidase
MAETTPLSVHHPEQLPAGGVIVVQEAFGVGDHIEDVCQRFAHAGWLAVAPHLFHRTGDPILPYGDFEQVMPHMRELTAEGILEDVDVALAYTGDAGLPPSGVGIVGFCMGGTVAFAVAAQRNLGAAVSFYGGGIAQGRFGFPPLVELAPQLRAPWLGLFGDLDRGIPVDDVEALRAAAATAEVATEVVRYPDAEHGFHRDGGANYHRESALDAWQRTLDWFARYLTTGATEIV